VLVGLDVAAPLADVQLDVEVAIVLERQDVVPAVEHAHAARLLDVARGDGTRFRLADAEHRLLDVVRHRKRERLEVADDLVDVLDDAGDRLVLVDHAVDAEAPHRRAAQRGEQHPPHRVA
jgi:hypothetical protein